MSACPGPGEEKQTDGKRWEREIDEMYTNLEEEGKAEEKEEDEEE